MIVDRGEITEMAVGSVEMTEMTVSHIQIIVRSLWPCKK